MRRASRVDDNQGAIVAAFRKLGCWVGDLSKMGQGWPDLAVSVPPSHVIAFVEVKDGAKPPSKRKLTGPEQEFHDSFPGMIWIVESLEHVENMVRYYRHG